ncbi:MAG TPA: HigA family addiction module antitoxin, partial [Bryobacteraceae bacterium]|nr:HigA family addiction module antitoxin [Bryobacteraceae bacterium]
SGETEKVNTASALTISSESVLFGERKDPAMSKSSITTKPAARLAPVHPGKILAQDMRDEEISINSLAQSIRVPANRISLIVNGKRSITADTAMRLARFFGTSPQYWMNIQNHYDLACVDQTAIEREVLPREAA